MEDPIVPLVSPGEPYMFWIKLTFCGLPLGVGMAAAFCAIWLWRTYEPFLPALIHAPAVRRRAIQALKSLRADLRKKPFQVIEKRLARLPVQCVLAAALVELERRRLSLAPASDGEESPLPRFMLDGEMWLVAISIGSRGRHGWSLPAFEEHCRARGCRGLLLQLCAPQAPPSSNPAVCVLRGPQLQAFFTGGKLRIA